MTRKHSAIKLYIIPHFSHPVYASHKATRLLVYNDENNCDNNDVDGYLQLPPVPNFMQGDGLEPRHGPDKGRTGSFIKECDQRYQHQKQELLLINIPGPGEREKGVRYRYFILCPTLHK